MRAFRLGLKALCEDRDEGVRIAGSRVLQAKGGIRL